MKNDIMININAKGIILSATSMHDWEKFIPAKNNSPQKEDFTVFSGSTFSIKTQILDFAIDYTP